MAEVERKSICARIVPMMRIIETVVARLLVIFHVGLLIFRGMVLGKNVYFTLPLSSCVFLLIPEAIFTYTKTKASEWKWLCPCILLFTLSTLPQIWMLEMDMNHEKRIQQEENRVSAVEVALEMQRQANVDPDQCSLKTLLPADEWKEIEEEMGEQRPPEKQERNRNVLNIPQKWKQQVTITSDAAKPEELGLMIDENLETGDESKCWRAHNKSTTIVFNFNQVLVIQKVVLYTGRHSFGPKSVVLIPLETVDGRIIRERDKRFKYAMEATKKQDGSYTLDLKSNIRSTTVFQYLELNIRPSSNSDTIICEIDIQYSNNYLASNGKTEFYEPPIRLDVVTDHLTSVDEKSSLVQRTYDDKLYTCSTFKKLKLKVQSVQDSYVMKPLTFNSLVLVPQTMSTPSYPVPVGDSSYNGGSQITMAPVLSVSSTDKSLHVNMTLSEETEIDLPPRISEGNTVITIESYNNSQNDFTLCEVRLHAKVEEDPPQIRESGRPRRDTDISASEENFSGLFYSSSSSKFESDQQSQSHFPPTANSREKRSASHMVIESLLQHSRLTRALSMEGGASRLRRNAEPFQPKSVFMLLDASQELKATITLVMEQLTMVTLLFIRWIIPRPVSMNPEQLAGCLAGWMGMMADQLNFLVLLDEEPVFTHPYFFYIVLCLFSFSQLQFSFVFPARVAVDPDKPKTLKTRLFGSFLWQSICILCLQDVPFMVVRIFSITHLKVMNHTVAYFIGKNIIVVSLQVYRMAWLLLQEKWARDEKKRQSNTVKESNDEKPNGHLNFNMEDMSHLPWIDDVIENDMMKARNSVVIPNGGGGIANDTDDEKLEKESLL